LFYNIIENQLRQAVERHPPHGRGAHLGRPTEDCPGGPVRHQTFATYALAHAAWALPIVAMALIGAPTGYAERHGDPTSDFVRHRKPDM
jgi:hypothetical protein